MRRYYFIAIGSSSRTQLGRIEQPDWSVGGKQNHLVALSNYISSRGMECAKHVNLVKVPTDISDSEAMIGRILSEYDYKQRALFKQLLAILEGENLARLAFSSGPHEPIKRRLNTDKAARKFRKVLASVKWEPKLTRWCHEILLHALDMNLLSIYLDVLQVLKAKCPVLVEHMIHSSMSMAGGEAFALLLTAVGLYSTDKQVKFEPAPIFVSLPYASIYVHHYSYLPPVETPRTPPGFGPTCNNLGIAFQLHAADTAK